MKKPQGITLPRSRGAFLATKEQAATLFTPEEIEKGEARFELKTVGPWHILASVRGFVATTQDKPTGNAAPCLTSVSESITFYGKRTISRPRNNGFGIVGSMRFNGKSRRIIDTNPLVQIEGGKLVSVAVLHVCQP